MRLAIISVCIFCCLFTINSGAQTIREYKFSKTDDSIITALKNFPQKDTNRLNTLVTLLSGQGLMFLSERKKKMNFWIEAYQLSKKLNQPQTTAYCYYWIAAFYKSSLNTDTALLYLDSAIQICKIHAGVSGKYDRIEAFSYESKGTIYFQKENYSLALKYKQEALKYFDGKSEQTTHNILRDLSDIYKELGNKREELGTYKKMEKLDLGNFGSNKNTLAFDQVYMLMASFYIREKNIDSAKIYQIKAGANMPDSSDLDFTAGHYRNWGRIYLLKKNYDSSLYFAKIALGYASTTPHGFNIRYAYLLLCDIERAQKDYKAAVGYADSTLKYGMNGGNNDFTASVYKIISDCKYLLGENKEAYEFLLKAYSIGDSSNFQKDKKSIANLAAFYESNQKETRILELEKKQVQQSGEIEKKSIVNKILIGGAVALLVIGFLGYRNFSHLQKLQHQKITELEKEKQLQAVDAMLKGQEEERSRIAKDLHDGLGGLLSGTKMSFMTIKENMVMNTEQVATFENSLTQLDNSIAELRKVAHNLMPEALIKFGLKKALVDYCNSLSASAGTAINFEHLGEERQLDNTASLCVYRIVQELVNNAVKYASATQILVQLTKTKEQVLLTVEDNGKGFDKVVLNTSDGIGYKSIKQRIAYFKGKLDIDTSPGNGTSVNIELYA